MALDKKKVDCPDECMTLLTIENINLAFSNQNPRTQDAVASCFYTCWYHSFLLSARAIYSSYSYNYINEMADIAFTDGIISFTQKAAKDGIYERTASAKSIAFTFFKNKLHECIRNDKLKTVSDDKEIYESDVKDEVPEEDKKSKMLDCLEKVKSHLKEEENKIIRWKYNEKFSNSEIAGRLNITTESFTNRLYRLTGRMEKLIKECLNTL